MNDASHVVYDSKYSFLGILTMTGFMVFSAVLLPLSLTRFNDFPVPVSLFAFLMLGIFFGAAMQKIVVEKDRFTIVTWRLVPVLRRQKMFLFSDVLSIEAYLPLTQGGDLDQKEWNLLHGPLMQKREKQNTLIIRNKDGAVVTLKPLIYRKAFHEALGHIGKLSRVSIMAADKEA
ncbi:MAG TPA: hypothetical protein VGS79_13155 [Puia sp.]|nr:hypothetical protein [Puia sp.]